MENRHFNRNTNNFGFAFRTGLILNVLFIALEVYYGFTSNSMALVSDAGHNFSDVIALVFSWLAVGLSQRKPTIKFTYGFRRSTILAAILNTILLLVAVVLLLWENVQRIGNPGFIRADSVIIVATAGILVNGFTAWLFLKGRKSDLNIYSAFMHFVMDTLVSLGVVVSGIIMHFTGATWIDSFVSLSIIAVIIFSSFQLLTNSVSLALDAVPENIDIASVRTYLCSIPEVSGIHDLHVWALSTNAAALTVHLETNIQTDFTFIAAIQKELNNRFKIEHTTIQVEYGRQSELCSDCN